MDGIMMNREIVLNGHWRLDAVNNQLVDLQGGAAGTVLSPVAVRLLMLLAESPETVIGRRRLFDAGWRCFGFEVCENSLNQVIHVLRAAFEQLGADAPRIKTVPRIGYCLMARVTTREAGLRSVAANPVTVATSERRLQERQVFDDIVRQQWNWAQHGEHLLSLLMVRCAPPAGTCLHDADAACAIERAILENIHRAGDTAARYASNGTYTEYAVLLPATDRQGAAVVARNILAAAQGHALTVGLACTACQSDATPEGLIEAARSELAHIPVSPPPRRPVHRLAA